MMKRHFVSLSALILLCALLFSACRTSEKTTQQTTAAPAAEAESGSAPYATENKYDVAESMFKKQSGVDYGTLVEDVKYYSKTAKADKYCNILLPAGYDESKTYPVMYMFHGFWSDHTTHLNKNSYLTILYGNMLHQNLTVPLIIVGVDMFTDSLEEKKSKTDEQLRYSYDKVMDDVKTDLMPFIEKNYPVKTGRENTAVAGLSEGGAKSLCTGFMHLDKIGYIAGFAPDAGVIPTESSEDSFWSKPIMKGFPQPNEKNTPYYLYMAVGSEDPWNIDCTLYYRDVLNDMGVKNQTDYVEGYGHDSAFWGQCFYNFLTKVFTCR
ncbi:MAG: hypothetical protein IKE65_08485 [Clostridia bacterium]|nr:hypothetical protein [Clostridia bacterium]